MWKELTAATRRLSRDRWSAGAAILVAALGTGLNLAVFAVAYGVLARPLPYRDEARLAIVDVAVPRTRIDAWRQDVRVFERLTAYSRDAFTMRGLAEARFLPVAVVDGAFFDTLGTPALVGRTLRPDDAAAMVISERLCRRMGLAGDTLLGRELTIGDMAATIVGVMPVDFAFPAEGVDVWIPASAARGIAFDRSRDERRFRLLGRLKADATFAHAREDVLRARRALDPEFTGTTPASVRVEPLRDVVVGRVRPVLLAFTGAATIVLLIACANVATILIGRSVARRRELAIRAAIGATRRQLFATVLSESMLIAAAAAALGTALALLAVRAFSRWAEGMLPRLGDVRIDWPVLGFALMMAAISALAAAAPALRATAPDALAVRVPVSDTRAGVRLRSILTAAQIALAVLLLSAGALLTRTIVDLLRGDIGAEPRSVLVSQLILTDSVSFNADDRRPWMANLLQHVRTIPGAIAAGAGTSLPPDNAAIAVTARIVTRTAVTETPELSLAAVTPGYLEALGVRLLRGRYFEAADDDHAGLVAMLSESAARVLMPDVDPIGTALPIDLPGMRGRGRPTVIGIVADVKYTGLEAARGPSIYVLWKELPAGQLYLALRTRGDPRAQAPTLQTVMRSVDPRIPAMPMRRLDDVVERSVADRRLRALLGGSIALLAFTIALVGLASGLARMVLERRVELAIRAALGATPGRALRSVMAGGAMLAAAGIAVGLLATLAAARVLRTLIFGVSPSDPATLGAVAVLVAAGSLLACYGPARRAARTDPLQVLRES